MKRDARLRRLSHEHHHALVLARRAGAGRIDAGELRRRFDEELAPHFATEEQTLLPALREAGVFDLAERTELEHRLIRESVLRGDLAELSRLLTAHVRFEERVLFPECERLLAPDVLAAV